MTVINIIVANGSGGRFQGWFRLLFLANIKHCSSLDADVFRRINIIVTSLKLQIHLKLQTVSLV